MKKSKNALRELIRLRGISMGDFSKAIGMSRQSLYNRLRNTKSITYAEAMAIERELGIKISQFL